MMTFVEPKVPFYDEQALPLTQDSYHCSHTLEFTTKPFTSVETDGLIYGKSVAG
jgi:hypothetical protein